MVFEMDWRKCLQCGWAGNPFETVTASRKIVDCDTGEWSSRAVELCPVCKGETCFDKQRATAVEAGEVPPSGINYSTVRVVQVRRA